MKGEGGGVSPNRGERKSERMVGTQLRGGIKKKKVGQKGIGRDGERWKETVGGKQKSFLSAKIVPIHCAEREALLLRENRPLRLSNVSTLNQQSLTPDIINCS